MDRWLEDPFGDDELDALLGTNAALGLTPLADVADATAEAPLPTISMTEAMLLDDDVAAMLSLPLPEPQPQLPLQPGTPALAETLAVPDGNRPYHAKRPHKKSRGGCRSCKTRKVKCDEARPRCRACTLRKEPCVYPTAAGTTAAARADSRASASAASAATTPSAAQAPSPSSSSSSSAASTAGDLTLVSSSGVSRSTTPTSSIGRAAAPHGDRLAVARSASHSLSGLGSAADSMASLGLVVSEPLFRPMDSDATDMKLLWFYTIKGYDAFAAEAGRQPKVDEVMQVTIPQHAFNNPFLMDCLLALSALELQQLGQPIEPARVLVYRTRAFAGYRRAVESATPAQLPALLACSLLLCALSSQMFRDPDCKPLYIVDWMVVWRGIGLMVKMLDPKVLFESGMAMIFARPPLDLDASAACIPNHLLFMASSMPADDPDYAHATTYYEALKYLGSLYRELDISIGRVLNLRTITWMTFLPHAFTELVRAHRPRALIIMAHYLVFVKISVGLWWMRGIADKEIRDVRDALGSKWHQYLAAPLAALETADQVTLGKILLNNSSWRPSFFHDANWDDQTGEMTMVDNQGHSVIFDGDWYRRDTGEKVFWNMGNTVVLGDKGVTIDDLAPAQPLQELDLNDTGEDDDND